MVSLREGRLRWFHVLSMVSCLNATSHSQSLTEAPTTAPIRACCAPGYYCSSFSGTSMKAHPRPEQSNPNPTNVPTNQTPVACCTPGFCRNRAMGTCKQISAIPTPCNPNPILEATNAQKKTHLQLLVAPVDISGLVQGPASRPPPVICPTPIPNFTYPPVLSCPARTPRPTPM